MTQALRTNFLQTWEAFKTKLMTTLQEKRILTRDYDSFVRSMAVALYGKIIHHHNEWGLGICPDEGGLRLKDEYEQKNYYDPARLIKKANCEKDLLAKVEQISKTLAEWEKHFPHLTAEEVSRQLKLE